MPQATYFDGLWNLPSVSWENEDGDNNHAQTQQYPENNDNLHSLKQKMTDVLLYLYRVYIMDMNKLLLE